jgi:hypothetical protein
MNTIDKVGLKQASINLKYYNVQELPYEPNSVLNEEEKDVVKEYCFNDCEISCLLYEKKIPDLELRKDVTKRYSNKKTPSIPTGPTEAGCVDCHTYNRIPRNIIGAI